MKFTGPPNLLVRLVRPIGRIRHFRFDEKGMFETENERLMKRLSHKFEVVPDRPAENKAEVKEEAKAEEVVKLRHCKKCDFTAENQGELLAHYKQVHPKKGAGKK